MMFSYKANRRWVKSERMKKRGKLEREVSRERKMLFVARDWTTLNCWRFEGYYEMMEGERVHQKWAEGEGEIVRHLCGDGRCVNPLHLRKGSDVENARDEIEIRDFEVEKMVELLGDHSMDGEDKALMHLTLLPRLSNKRAEEVGYFVSLKKVNMELREMYRKMWVREFIDKNKDNEELVLRHRDKLTLLSNRDDIVVITVPN